VSERDWKNPLMATPWAQHKRVLLTSVGAEEAVAKLTAGREDGTEIESFQASNLSCGEVGPQDVSSVLLTCTFDFMSKRKQRTDEAVARGTGQNQ
jgi:hypothetical protein